MRKFIYLFLFTQFTFSQSTTSKLETQIYNNLDVFVANANIENLKKLEQFEKTLQPKSKPELLATVILNCNKAYYENLFGETKKAISSYEKAWQMYQKNKLSKYDIIESCLKPLGNLYTHVGEYENAEKTIKQYFYIANFENNKLQKFAAILNLSNVYQNIGSVNEAINLLEKTLAVETLSNSQKGILFNNLGNNYLTSGDPKKARKSYLLSINYLHTDTNQLETLSNSYRNLALLNNDLQLFEKAKKIFLETRNNEPKKIAKLHLDEATLLYKQGNFDKANESIILVFKTLIPNYNSSNLLPKKNSLYAETSLLDALDLQGLLFLNYNKPQKALQCYMLCFHIEALFQELLMYENSKIVNQMRNRKRTEKCIEIYYNLFQKEKKVSYLEHAFYLSEQGKASVLKNTIHESTTMSNDEKLIKEQLQNWTNTILKEQQKANLADISIINEAIKKQNELMLLLKSKNFNENIQQEKEFDLQELYSKLEKDKSVLVCYFSGFTKMYSFTLQNHTISINSFDDIAKAETILYDFLSYFKDANAISSNLNGFINAANNSFRFLKLPTNKYYKNLLIIPDGILNFVPFEALLTSKNKSSNFAKMPYLLKDFKIGYANSAAFYLNFDKFKTNRTSKKQNVLGVFPVFKNSALELAFSVKEMDAIKKNFDGKYLNQSEATFANFKLNAANYSILHLSTHASSGDIIEPASIKFYDGDVLYSELYNLNINPNLVILSACETGLGKLYKGEGAMSISRGFQMAGAQNLLFSLWKVNDYTTSILMEKFYKNLKKGKSYFNSNHQAKLDFLADETISNTKKSPYYWSAFVYYGTIEEESSINYFWWIIFIGSSIGLFLLFKIIKMKDFQKILKKEKYKKINFKVSKTQHLLAKATINGVKGNFILDTGASNSCVGFESIEKFNLLTKESKTKASGAGATGMITQISKNNIFQLGRWRETEFHLVIFDLSHVNLALTQHKAKAVDGIIGADILLEGKAIIDYYNRCFYLK